MIRCPFPGCSHCCSLRTGVCESHWNTLTDTEKSRFVDAWHQYGRHRMDADQLKLVHAHLTEHTEGRLANA